MILFVACCEGPRTKFDDGARTFDGVAVHSADVHTFSSEAYNILKVAGDASVIARVSHCT